MMVLYTSHQKKKLLNDKKILSAAIYMNAKEDTKFYKEIIKDILCVAPEYGKKIARTIFSKDLKCGNIFMNLEEPPSKSNKIIYNVIDIYEKDINKAYIIINFYFNHMKKVNKTISYKDLLKYIDSEYNDVLTIFYEIYNSMGKEFLDKLNLELRNIIIHYKNNSGTNKIIELLRINNFINIDYNYLDINNLTKNYLHSFFKKIDDQKSENKYSEYETFIDDYLFSFYNNNSKNIIPLQYKLN